MNTINKVKQTHIVPDSFDAIILKLFIVLPNMDPVLENWSFYHKINNDCYTRKGATVTILSIKPFP